MDLIYTNSSRVDQGVLLDYELDLAFGSDENSFECCVRVGSHCCESGSLLYMEGTEYGGIVDSIESVTDSKEVIYTGRTWHGILNSKVLQPDSGAAYLTVSGEANSVIASLLTRMGLTDLFAASSEDSGLTVKSYKMNRYISGYDGIMKMLGTFGGKLKMAFSDGKVVLSAVARVDYTQDEEFDADQVPFRAKRNYKGVNHLICLGSGQLEDRMVVHLYADTEGNISQTQTQFDLDEICSIYEYSSIETVEELIQEGTETFKSLMVSDEISIDFDADSDAYDVGDIIGAVDNITGLVAHTTIDKKIVTIKNGQITVSLSPDTARIGSSKESGGVGDKQSKLIGKKGQLVGFNSQGNAEAVDPPYCNRNLLDNWYFGNPVDQRGGYVVKPNAAYYAVWDGSAPTGYTDKYYAATQSADHFVFVMNGTAYHVDSGDCVRGYTGTGYGIDRWQLVDSRSVLSIDGGCVRYIGNGQYTNLLQKIENAKLYAGKTLTISVLREEASKDIIVGALFDGGFSQCGTSTSKLISHTFTLPEAVSNALHIFVQHTDANNASNVHSLVAVKLELGTQQTLAHQDDNGNWVLNEIPDFGEELRKCQRYYCKSFPYSFAPTESLALQSMFSSFGTARNNGSVAVRFPVEMRSTPTVRKIGKAWCFANQSNGSESDTYDQYIVPTHVLPTGFFIANNFFNGFATYGFSWEASADL